MVKKKNKQLGKSFSEVIGLNNILQNDVVNFIVGLVLIFLSIYVIIAFISFFSTGQYDQSLILDHNPQEVLNKNREFKNSCGSFGAFVSYFFISRCFGLSAFVIPVFMIIFTLRGFLGNLIYISSYTEYVGNTQTSDGYTMLFLLMGIYIAILVLEYIFFNKEKNKISKTENIFYWMYTLAIIFQILATTQSLVARIVLYFSLSLIILLPNIIEKIENKKLVVLINFILVVLIMVFSFTNEPLEPYKLYFK